MQARQSIAYQEFFFVVNAAHLWGSLWARKHVLFQSDNKAVVAILMTRTSKFPLKCTFSVIFCFQRHIGIILSLLLMFLDLRTTTFPLAGVHAAGSGGSFFPLSDSSAPAAQLNTSSLKQRYLHFLAHGLAPSTRKAYVSDQHKIAEFCGQAGKLHHNNNNNNNNKRVLFADGLCHIMWFSIGHCIKTKNDSPKKYKILNR